MTPTVRHIILEKEGGFRFFTDASGAHFLEVLCGTIALFSICVRLSENELSNYREFGAFFIEKLASKIAHSPDSFTERNVSDV